MINTWETPEKQGLFYGNVCGEVIVKGGYDSGGIGLASPELDYILLYC
ncbi:hypothetical protein [Flexithrix dorotheae]|nr:hypothetical protein [Flexithrix dorotheae]